jgi:EAL domain-containing protein (putative c-di-GMP-specific phosphodiesterase class I)
MRPTTVDREHLNSVACARGVLVVDDNEDQRDYYLHILPRVGEAMVFTASSGDEALQFLSVNAEKIGLVICDLQMPGMDGMALLRRIGEASHDLSVIVSSSADSGVLRSVELMGRAMGLKVLGSLPKPVSRAMLDNLLRRYRQTPTGVPRTHAFGLVPADFDRALLAGEFVPYFQPKVNLTSREVTGVEALARWAHPARGILQPVDFLPLIDSPAKLSQLTRSIVASSITHAAAWQKRDCRISLSINLSLSALDNDFFCEDVQALLDVHGMKPEDITFEILETAAMTDIGRTLETLSRLRLNGFGLAIDDFGTGFSTLEQLSNIPFTELKIDRVFVQGASQTPRLAAVVRSCVDLAHRLQLKIVAEGIETEADWNYLAGAGATEGQGYFIAKPMAGDAVVAWVEHWAATHGRPDGAGVA